MAIIPKTLAPNERIAAIRKEHHVRRMSGMHICYIVEDKFYRHLFLGQKLASIVMAINELIPDVVDHVSVTGLYQSMQRAHPCTKHRWTSHPVAIDDAAQVFEKVRIGYDNASVVGAPDCYRTISV